MSKLQLIEPITVQQLATVRELFLEYADALDFNLNFQSFDRDINELPGMYARPHGRLYMAIWDGQLAGCVALKKLGSGICELKRLWVKPQFRRNGIGRAMTGRLIEDARAIGYEKMMLDTVDTMTAAMALYESMGFRRTETYYDNPIEGATHFEMDLT